MKNLILYKSMISTAFVLALAICGMLYLHFTQHILDEQSWVFSALWGVILLTFALFILGWKLILDTQAQATEAEGELLMENDTENEESTTEEEKIDTEAIKQSIFGTMNGVSKDDYFESLLRATSRTLEFDTALSYQLSGENYEPTARWAFYNEEEPASFKAGEGLCGQAALECKSLMIDNLPDSYFTVLSGSGQSAPQSLYIIPLKKEDKCIGLLEFASLKKGQKNLLRVLDNLQESFVEHYDNTHQI